MIKLDSCVQKKIYIIIRTYSLLNSVVFPIIDIPMFFGCSCYYYTVIDVVDVVVVGGGGAGGGNGYLRMYLVLSLDVMFHAKCSSELFTAT